MQLRAARVSRMVSRRDADGAAGRPNAYDGYPIA